MKTYLDCVPCFVRQALDAVRMTTDDESVQQQVLQWVLREASEMDISLSPPAMGQKIHRRVREITGNPDPYLAVKERTNQLAMALYPELRARVHAASDPLDMAVRTAIAGNIIDFGLNGRVSDEAVQQSIDRAATAPLYGDVGEFAREAASAPSILYLADNAGEIVFDRLLIETLGPHRVTLAVKGAPVLNDALRADAEAAGLLDIVNVVDNGSDAPGTILTDCSETFRSRFAEADLVIAKGQGNYETLSNAPRPVWFILMAKCEVIAQNLGCDRGSFVLHRGPAGSTA